MTTGAAWKKLVSVDDGQKQPLSDMQLMGLVLREVGPGGLARLVAFCAFWFASGVRTHEKVNDWAAELRSRGGPARATIYAALADLRQVHRAWADREGRPYKDAPALDELLELRDRLVPAGRVLKTG